MHALPVHASLQWHPDSRSLINGSKVLQMHAGCTFLMTLCQEQCMKLSYVTHPL